MTTTSWHATTLINWWCVTIRVLSVLVVLPPNQSVSACVHAGSVRGVFTTSITTTDKNSNFVFW